MSISSEPIFRGWLCVPKNDQGTHSLDYGLEDRENVIEWELTPEENTSLGSFYLAVNDLIGTLLDFCEEDVINASDAPVVLNLLTEWAQHERDAFWLSACAKLGESLKCAVEYGTFVELWL